MKISRELEARCEALREDRPAAKPVYPLGVHTFTIPAWTPPRKNETEVENA